MSRSPSSYTDWNFENVNWELDDGIWHTAPPSFTASALCTSLVKHATTGALSDGRLVTWIRSSTTTTLGMLLFRNQKADGAADHQDSYVLFINDSEPGLRLYRYIGGAFSTIDTKAHTWAFAANTWYKIRITWWSAADRLFLRTERWTGTEWVTFGGAADDDIEDPDDQFKDAEVNRCGVRPQSIWWFDDLEVWG